MLPNSSSSLQNCAYNTAALLMILLSSACIELCTARLCCSHLDVLPSTHHRRLYDHDSTITEADTLYTLQPEKKSWQEAYNSCVNQGLELVEYSTEANRKSLDHFCGKDRMSEGPCWEGNHPGENGCTMFLDGELTDNADCDQLLSYLCKEPSSPPPSPDSPEPAPSPPPSYPSPSPSPSPGHDTPPTSDMYMPPSPRPDVVWKPVPASMPPPAPSHATGNIVGNGNLSPTPDGNSSGTLREADVTASTSGGDALGVNWVIMTVVISGTALIGLTTATVAMVVRARRRLQADVQGQIANDSANTLYVSPLEYGSPPPTSPASQPSSQRYLLASYGSQRSLPNSL